MNRLAKVSSFHSTLHRMEVSERKSSHWSGSIRGYLDDLLSSNDYAIASA